MAGKGCAPRSCYSPAFKARYEEIDWRKPRSPKPQPKEPRRHDWRRDLEETGDVD